MDQQYLDFLGADRDFYDVSGSEAPRGRRYELPLELDWADWQRVETRAWTHVDPGLGLPEQGWKIHVSATLDNAQRILNTVAQYAWRHRVSFKWAPTDAELLARNDKQADRGSSGKFITLYPRELDELEATLRSLDALIGGEAGPYILSDLRWNAGPLYVRYGAFVSMWAFDEEGERVPAIAAPSGTLVPDARLAAFTPPEWVDLPAFLAEQAAALGGEDAPADFPYDIERALHFSNGGGVYLAFRRTDGLRVVLKEARPHAGVTPDGRDAVARLEAEERALRILNEDPATPRLLDAFELNGHRFLVIEYIDGVTLNAALASRAPIVRPLSRSEDYRSYRDWALGVAAQLDAALSRFHAAGIVVGDIHPRNLMVEGTERLVLIDFEMASPVSDRRASLLGAPGFTAPMRATGAEADRYSAACVKLFLFLPLTQLLPLDPAKAGLLVEAAAVTYQLPRGFADELKRDLDDNMPQRPASARARQADRLVADWSADSEDRVIGTQVMIARAIGAGSDFSRADRCFPGDIRQFSEGAIGLAHGAAGVILALRLANLEVDVQADEWLDDALAREDDPPLGLYDGLAGIAWMRRTTGDHAQASALHQKILARLAERLSPRAAAPLPSGLYGGLAGLGLYLLDEGSGDGLEVAGTIGSELLRRSRTESANSPARQRGLMWGASGVALFAARLFEHTGDESFLDLAQQQLQADFDRLAKTPDGSLQMDEGWRLMPYLATGSAGVGLAAVQILPHVEDPERLLRVIDKIQLAAQAPFTIESGVFDGRAGLIHFLTALARLRLATPESQAALAAHVEALRLHAVRYRTGIAFPGTGLMRLSFDFATGSAGVLSATESYNLLAFDSQRDGHQFLLPLLLPRTRVSERG